MSNIASVEAWHVDIPLTPFPLGTRTISRRDYTVVRVRDADGAEGVAWGLARRAPIALLIEQMLAPALLGATLDTTFRVETLLAAALGLHYREGLLSRAASLVDIALVDLLATRQGVPAWKLLAPGARPRPLRFSNVVGFEQQDESDAAFVQRVTACIDAGYESVKLAASAVDPDAFARRLRAIRAACPYAEILVDLDGSWSDVDRTVLMAQDWEREQVTWIEDAVRIDQPALVAALHDRLQAPLAIGDEATSLPLLLQLAERRLVDVLRVDLTCVGGLSAVANIRDIATTNGVGLSFHAYPWIHQHAAIIAGLNTVESFEVDSPFEVSHRFLAPLPLTRMGDAVHVDVPTRPGLGVEIDWAFIDHHKIAS